MESSIFSILSSASPSMNTKKSTSTLLDGNHSFPPFYACYLLRSRASPNSQRTYVGSTPNPPKRLRQHNGEISQGARKTSHFRPWEMQMIIYGFPSKLAALQFEWAWQKPELSRHLRHRDPASDHDKGPIFKKDARRNGVERKTAVALALLRVDPFATWPLHVRFFSSEVHDIFCLLNSNDTVEIASTQVRRKRTTADVSVVANLLPLNESVSLVLDLGGVDGSRNRTWPMSLDEDNTKRPIDTSDSDFRCGEPVWGKWESLRLALKNELVTDCGLCKGNVDLSDHLKFALCPSKSRHSTVPCLCVTHLSCLAQNSLRRSSSVVERISILPHSSTCPQCQKKCTWGEIIRSCYGRRDGLLRENYEKGKLNLRKRARKIANSQILPPAENDIEDDDSPNGNRVKSDDDASAGYQ